MRASLLVVMLCSACVVPLKQQKLDIPGLEGGPREMAQVLAYWRYQAATDGDQAFAAAIDSLGERVADDRPSAPTLGCVHARTQALVSKLRTRTGRVDGVLLSRPGDVNAAGMWVERLGACEAACSRALADSKPADRPLLNESVVACRTDLSAAESYEIAHAEVYFRAAAEAIASRQMVLFTRNVSSADSFRKSAKSATSRERITARIAEITAKHSEVFARDEALRKDPVFLEMVNEYTRAMQEASRERQRSGEGSYGHRQLLKEMEAIGRRNREYEERALQADGSPTP